MICKIDTFVELEQWHSAYLHVIFLEHLIETKFDINLTSRNSFVLLQKLGMEASWA
jgi:hypothetical protein